MKPLYIWLFVVAFLPFTVRSQKVDSIKYKFGQLYYHEYGKGEPIVLLSGGPGGSFTQLQEVAVQVAKEHRAILLEQRGTGRSIPQPFDSTTINLQSALDDLNLLLKHLGIQKATFLGHSWGAMLAMSFAASYPAKVKSLLLVSPGPYNEWNKNSQILQMSWKSKMGRQEQMSFDSINVKIANGSANAKDMQTRRRLILESYNFDKSLYDTIQQKIGGASNLKMRDLMLYDLGRNYDLSRSLRNFKGSIDVICGRQDYVVYNAYELKLLMSQTKLHWLEECGHWPQFEQPKAFYDTLFAILKQKN